MTDIIGEITAAAAEQSDGIGQVNDAVTQLDQMTQQNAALVEESAAAAESLKDQAARLAEVVGTFQLDGRGAAPGGRRRRACHERRGRAAAAPKAAPKSTDQPPHPRTTVARPAHRDARPGQDALATTGKPSDPPAAAALRRENAA